jgi:hypothetical protein
LLAALVGIRLGDHVGQPHGFVERKGPQVDADVDEAGQAAQRAFGIEQVLKGLVLGAGIVGIPSDIDRDARQDADIVAAASVAGQPSGDVGPEGLCLIEGLCGGEDQFGGTRSQFAAIGGRTGLGDHRPALNWARGIERP